MTSLRTDRDLDRIDSTVASILLWRGCTIGSLLLGLLCVGALPRVALSLTRGMSSLTRGTHLTVEVYSDPA